MQTFCTIITGDYFSFAKTLFASLKKFDSAAMLQVLVVDENVLQSEDEGLELIHLKEVSKSPLFIGLRNKYEHTNKDYFRWSLKPVLLCWLLERGFQKVIFVDPDLFFVNKYDFLFKMLDSNSILLTPHWNDIRPVKLEESLIYLFRNGLFNAGFVAATPKGLPALHWWAEACHYKTEKQPELGVYVDQKYLDIFPVEFPETGIIKHRGCNLASWNMHSSIRSLHEGKLVINGHYEPVFVHFTFESIFHIQNGNDPLLKPYLEEYQSILKKMGGKLPDIKKGQTSGVGTFTHKIKRRLLIRTRVKQLFFKVAEKL